MTKQSNTGLIIYFFSILFLPRIGSFDLTLAVLPVFFLFSLSQEKTIKLNKRLALPISLILLLVTLFLINSFINKTDLQIFLRYLRCIFSTICISCYINYRKPAEEQFINALTFVLLIHAISIIASIVIPSIRPYIYIISGYSKKYLPLRSTGLLSGYDFAGYYLNAGVFLRFFYNTKYRDKVFDLQMIIFIVAIIFTSRINTLVLMAEMILIIFYMFRTKRISSSMTLVIVIPLILIGFVFSILTIEQFAPLKYSLMQRYQWISSLDKTINLTYADSTIQDALTKHYDIESSVNLFIGNGVIPKKDPGIIKTIYEGGYTALLTKMLFYLDIFVYAFRRRNNSTLHSFLAAYVVLTAIMELKLSFFFASGSFELLITTFCACLVLDAFEVNNGLGRSTSYSY